jgi:hypothetical protein
MADVLEAEQMSDLVERCPALHLGRERPPPVIVKGERDPSIADLGADILAPRLADAGARE